MTKAYRLLIKGVVQKVGFRQFVKNLATRHYLAGSVKNLPEPYLVEVLIYMPEKMLPQILSELKKGPALSRVEDIKVEKILAKKALDIKKGQNFFIA